MRSGNAPECFGVPVGGNVVLRLAREAQQARDRRSQLSFEQLHLLWAAKQGAPWLPCHRPTASRCPVEIILNAIDEAQLVSV